MNNPTKYDMLINGQWCATSDGAPFDSIDPSNRKVWATVAEASADNVDRAVRAAAKAGDDGPWTRMTPTERGKFLRRHAHLLVAESEFLGRVEARDTGKIFRETKWQAKYVAEFFEFFAGVVDKMTGDTLAIEKRDMFVFTDPEPLSAVAEIVPWNSQLFLSAVKLDPALPAGNTMVLKASEHAAAPILDFGKLIVRAKIPNGVVNIITGHSGPCSRVLTSHPLVARVSFTGGPVSAAHVIRNSAENFAKLSLELGGKSPFIVFDDTNLESAVNGSVVGILAAAGQICVAGSRLYLHAAIAEAFFDEIVGIAKAIQLGDPQEDATEMGPLCTLAQLEHIEQQVARAEAEGGVVLTGGKRVAGQEGLYFEPTKIDCPRQDVEIVDTELF